MSFVFFCPPRWKYLNLKEMFFFLTGVKTSHIKVYFWTSCLQKILIILKFDHSWLRLLKFAGICKFYCNRAWSCKSLPICRTHHFFLSTLQVIHVYQANTNNMHLKYDAKKRIFDNLGGKILKRYLKCSVPFFFIKTKFLWKNSERSPLKSMAIKSKTHFRTNINHGERLYIQRGYSARHPYAKKNKLGSPLKKSVGDSKNHF